MSGTTNANPGNNHVGIRLIQKGWTQGSIFDAPSLVFKCNGLVADRHLKSKEKLIVVSQDCDILAKPEVEPYVEAMICTSTENQKILAMEFSWRQFVVDKDTGLFVQAKYRTLVKKELLEEFEPQPWPGLEWRRRDFVRWLGVRFTRPAIPTEVVEAFEQPARHVLKNLRVENASLLIDFNRSVREMRLAVLRDSKDAPFRVQPIIVLNPDGVSSEGADAVKAITDQIQAASDTSRISLNSARITTYEDMTAAEYLNSFEWYLDYFTYEGGEIVGAEPDRGPYSR